MVVTDGLGQFLGKPPALEEMGTRLGVIGADGQVFQRTQIVAILVGGDPAIFFGKRLLQEQDTQVAQEAGDHFAVGIGPLRRAAISRHTMAMVTEFFQ